MEPWTDLGMWNSFSSWEGLQISIWAGDLLSVFRTTRSFAPDGDGTIVDTPLISAGKGAHWKLTQVLLSFEIRVDRTNFLLLFPKRLGWLIKNIAWESNPETKDFVYNYYCNGFRKETSNRVDINMVQIRWAIMHTTVRLKSPNIVNVGDAREFF